jgi:hypothetical protein
MMNLRMMLSGTSVLLGAVLAALFLSQGLGFLAFVALLGAVVSAVLFYRFWKQSKS